MIDLDAVRAKWLKQCGSCDLGYSCECTHPGEDYRPVMAELVALLERIRDRALVMLDGNGGWYGVPFGGRDAASVKFAMPTDYFPHAGPYCDARHPLVGFVCSKPPRHSDRWHTASDGKILLAKWVAALPRDASMRTCPEPAVHATLYAAREQTARLTAEQRAAETTPGTCSWCGAATR